MRVPLFQPKIREDAIQAVSHILRSGWLEAGATTEAFEQAFAQYVEAAHCVALNSGTAALHLALRLLDLPPGSEVITTPITFVSTNHAILYERCTPVFADIQLKTGNLDVQATAAKITERTRVIMVVHYGGYPCDLDEFYALAHQHGLVVIEDCAHACGATYKNRRIGGHGQLHAFSFNAVKNLAIGGGGALTVSTKTLALRAQRLRWLGIDRETFQRTSTEDYRWEYDVTEIGFKYQMNDIQAAIGLAQLPYLNDDNAARAKIAAQYQNQLSTVPGIQLLTYEPDRTSSFHLFCVLAENREALAAKLRRAGVDVSVHYKRNDLYPMYTRQHLPNAEQFWRHVLSLPMYPDLTEEQIDYVARVIEKGW